MSLSIQQPCLENWEAMSPTEQGKFCSNCQKEVVNFTTYSLAEIKQHLERTSDSCGRFRKMQIEAFNVRYQALPTPSRIRAWAGAAVLTAVVALPSFANTASVVVDTLPPTPVMPLNSSTVTTETPLSSTPKSATVTLSGKVVDRSTATPEGLPFATVYIAEKEKGVQTDFDGLFSIEVPQSEEPITLVVSYVGYPTEQYKIVPNQNRAQLVLAVKENLDGSTFLTGIVVSMPYQKSKKQYRRQQRAEKRALKKAARSAKK